MPPPPPPPSLPVPAGLPLAPPLAPPSPLPPDARMPYFKRLCRPGAPRSSCARPECSVTLPCRLRYTDPAAQPTGARAPAGLGCVVYARDGEGAAATHALIAQPCDQVGADEFANRGQEASAQWGAWALDAGRFRPVDPATGAFVPGTLCLDAPAPFALAPCGSAPAFQSVAPYSAARRVRCFATGGGLDVAHHGVCIAQADERQAAKLVPLSVHAQHWRVSSAPARAAQSRAEQRAEARRAPAVERARALDGAARLVALAAVVAVGGAVALAARVAARRHAQPLYVQPMVARRGSAPTAADDRPQQSARARKAQRLL